ncbi:VanZ family protein [Halomonas sp. I5-271120]|uniref:VanZ family protein n=1 Tax=Halomonas sp. I5-271120 TaxID=3061632 RepID=UPI002714D06F|nr:VanZ family protein [Halomonas sp. I5-271120]
MGFLIRLHERRHAWAGLAVLAALVIAIGSLAPGNEMPDSLPWDKANHFIGYGGLAGLVGLAGISTRPAFIGVVAYGVAIEFAQLPVPGRMGGDPWDILANTLGALLGLAVLALLRRCLLRDGA